MASRKMYDQLIIRDAKGTELFRALESFSASRYKSTNCFLPDAIGRRNEDGVYFIVRVREATKDGLRTLIFTVKHMPIKVRRLIRKK